MEASHFELFENKVRNSFLKQFEKKDQKENEARDVLDVIKERYKTTPLQQNPDLDDSGISEELDEFEQRPDPIYIQQMPFYFQLLNFYGKMQAHEQPLVFQNYQKKLHNQLMDAIGLGEKYSIKEPLRKVPAFPSENFPNFSRKTLTKAGKDLLSSKDSKHPSPRHPIHRSSSRNPSLEPSIMNSLPNSKDSFPRFSHQIPSQKKSVAVHSRKTLPKLRLEKKVSMQTSSQGQSKRSQEKASILKSAKNENLDEADILTQPMLNDFTSKPSLGKNTVIFNPLTNQNLKPKSTMKTPITALNLRDNLEELRTNEILARRYGISISRKEFNNLKRDQIISNNIFDFIAKYLMEKMKSYPEEQMSKYQMRIYVFPFSFYTEITNNDLNSVFINPDVVDGYMDKIDASGKSIFESYDSLIIPLNVSQFEYALVMVSLTNKRFILFDPTITNISKEKQAINNQILINISRVIQKEAHRKQWEYVDIYSWEFYYEKFSIVEDIKECTLHATMILYAIFQNSQNFSYQEEKLKSLQARIMSLIMKIGISQGNDKPISNIRDFEL